MPDIDFNIRAGNTLVGFAKLEEVEKAVKGSFGKILLKKEIDAIKEQAEMVKMAYERFKDSQVVIDSPAMSGEKQVLEERLRRLNDTLNIYLARLYEVDIERKPCDFEKWKTTHQPFHWFAEFYQIIHDKGGFDVIIGNPPYLEFRQINYALKNYNSADTKAVHAVCIERSSQLINKNGAISMVVPLSIVSTQRMKIVQEIIEANRTSWYTNYSWRPAKLFDTVNRALTIFVAIYSANPVTFSTTYQKWISETREELMDRIYFNEVPRERKLCWIPKISSPIETLILQIFQKFHTILGDYFRNSNYPVYYRTDGGLYWKVFTDFPPEFKVNGKSGHSSRETWFAMPSREHAKSAIALLSSNIFWWWYTVTSNCRHLNPFDIQNFPINEKIFADINLHKLGFKYLTDLQTNSVMLVREQKQTGKTETQCFKIQKSKPIIDEIDKVLAQHYGFTDEELDFIINYDIKYRMGKELDVED